MVASFFSPIHGKGLRRARTGILPMALKFTMSVPAAMKGALDEERKRRKLDTIQDTIRSILAEYFAGKR